MDVVSALSFDARLRLAATRQGVVAGVTSASLLIEDPIFGIVSLVDAAAPDGPGVARLAQLPCADVGSSLQIGPDGIRSADFNVDWSRSRGWAPCPVVEPAKGWRQRSRYSAAWASRRCRDEIDEALIRELRASLGEAHSQPFTNAVRRLIGLGPGLTPAGDDLLLGLGVAATFGLTSSWVGDRLRAFLPAIASKTHALSNAYFAGWIDDVPPAPIADLACAILTGIGVSEARKVIAGVGASTGTYWALGLTLDPHHEDGRGRTSSRRQHPAGLGRVRGSARATSRDAAIFLGGTRPKHQVSHTERSARGLANAAISGAEG